MSAELIERIRELERENAHLRKINGIKLKKRTIKQSLVFANDRIKELESELDATRKWGEGWQEQFDEAQSKNKILREALQPFSDFYAAFPISYVVDGDEIVIFGFNDTALRIRHFLNTVETLASLEKEIKP